jgi:hypothetical protein
MRIAVSIDDLLFWPSAQVGQPTVEASALADELMIGALTRHSCGL